ncbi:uncharacterized protein SPPG_09247 [Spizellomyces punctatus DAOM BR117]|uniref:Uncharacterized protein n=1 Tax=Spizellomyces punctatus (strain DAOM BR117) TaxID=645134 RepID=A0A0L0HF66_SPIPD|nr:uncharacterized protein SPPG_09247 [Spizellomyces punctatus DAOM BR117]KNC99681.1 hypothetical protein SPPG_09247 [Spizellomyces punctatus DAOM BR117]|eukprot:XP_016607721.1 hypothetical protein SPPG_09247 [Spizellomyces punctatus DAOM BR117]
MSLVQLLDDSYDSTTDDDDFSPPENALQDMSSSEDLQSDDTTKYLPSPISTKKRRKRRASSLEIHAYPKKRLKSSPSERFTNGTAFDLCGQFSDSEEEGDGDFLPGDDEMDSDNGNSDDDESDTLDDDEDTQSDSTFPTLKMTNHSPHYNEQRSLRSANLDIPVFTSDFDAFAISRMKAHQEAQETLSSTVVDTTEKAKAHASVKDKYDKSKKTLTRIEAQVEASRQKLWGVKGGLADVFKGVYEGVVKRMIARAAVDKSGMVEWDHRDGRTLASSQVSHFVRVLAKEIREARC